MSAVATLERATAADVDAIAAVFRACWHGPYRGLLDDAVIARWDEASARELWARQLADRQQRVVVARVGSEVAGVVRFGPAVDGAVDGEAGGAGRVDGVGEVGSLYVDPAHAGGGIGRALLERAEAELAADGWSEARLWVFARNAAARGFYERAGWVRDGRTRVEREFAAEELGMTRMLGAGREMRSEMAAQPTLLRELIARREQICAQLRETFLEAPRGLVLVARGSSDNAALYGRYVLELALRRPVALAAPSLWTRYGLSESLDGQLAIAVSQSGRTPEITTTLTALRRAGARAIAITNDGDSPLAEEADATIALGVGRERAVPATKTFTAQLAAFAFVAEALGSPPWRPEEWAALPAAQAALLADPEPAREAAELIARGSGTIHLGRGMLYAVALEAALKLAETSLLPSIGYSSADFLHGPVASASERTPVIAHLADGPVADDVRTAAAAARAAGAPLIAVGAAIEGAAVHVPVPAGTPPVPEALAPLLHTIRAQQIAAETTLALGADPDSPPGLRKVTATH